LAEPRPLLIFPCNGNAIEALDCLGTAYQFVGFVDDTPDKQRNGAFGHQVLPRKELEERPICQVLAVPGSPTSYSARRGLIDGLGIDVSRFARVIHPAAQISTNATIGYNVLIMAGVVVTSNAIIGNHVCLLPNTVVHHDSSIGDWSLIGTNVSVAGGVDIGENCFVGSGSSIRNGVRIGDGALIGLGSTVIHDVPASAVVAGNPARILQ
jgi:sugar O-acyltransferase (sialic acid O-acetyltransferase NeuD family)